MGDTKETYEIDTTGSTEEVVRSPESKFDGKLKEGNNTFTLGDLAYARSGDKGTQQQFVGRTHLSFHVLLSWRFLLRLTFCDFSKQETAATSA